METNRQKSNGRAHSILHEAVSRFLQETANPMPMITVSFVQLNKTGHSVTVYCSVLPAEESEKVLAFLKRKESLCRDYLRKHTSLRALPTVRFAIAKDTVHIS